MNTLVSEQSDVVPVLYSEMNDFYRKDDEIKALKKAFPESGKLENNQKCFYKIMKLSYDEEYPRREAFENVLLSMDDPAFNFVYILSGNKNGIELCIGVVKNGNFSDNKLSAADYGKILCNSFEGNFNGSELVQIRADALNNLLHEQPKKYTSAGFITGIPTMNGADGESEYDFQGIDRLINSMLGLEWRIVVVCEPITKSEIISLREDIYDLHNRLSLFSEMTMQSSTNSGNTETYGKSSSNSRSKNKGWSESDSSGESWDDGKKNKGNQKTRQGGSSTDHSESKNYSTSTNSGKSNSLSVMVTYKRIEETLVYLDEELLERLNLGFSKGLFNTAVYYMAENKAGADRLKGCIMSLFQGNRSTHSPLTARPLSADLISKDSILSTYQLHYEHEAFDNLETPLLFSRPYKENCIGLCTYLTSSEICLFSGLPQNEVMGVSLKSSVRFGLNTKNNAKDPVALGHIIQNGRLIKQAEFSLDRECFSKHIFVAGVTGSGKTTTCHKLLYESGIPFLVIEPAKTEYRCLIDNKQFNEESQSGGVTVFTLGNESCAPFRLNPFELLEGEIISSHIDMLKAAFTSAFPMEASMPQLLEEAMHRCYEEKRWDTSTNENSSEMYKNPNNFPTLSDLLRLLPVVVKEKQFGDRMQSEYVGSLISRLSNLTKGAKGRMLNCRKSVDFGFLIRNHVVLELEELKSPEDKAFLIGLILMRLAERIKAEHKKNHNFKHITLVEEAHRLLTKAMPGDSGARKSAVETFTDLLAEVRKYGEGIVIVDQIPNKLAPDVLKNTNTKIIHKLLARDDKEAVGDTMLMSDKQKEYLSALPTGCAVVFSETTDNPVNIQVKRMSDTNAKDIDEEEVKKRFEKMKQSMGNCYTFSGADKIAGKIKDTCITLFRCRNSGALEAVNSDAVKAAKSLIGAVQKAAEYNDCDTATVWKQAVDTLEMSAMQGPDKADMLYRFFTEIMSVDDFSLDMIDDDNNRLLGGYSKC